MSNIQFKITFILCFSCFIFSNIMGQSIEKNIEDISNQISDFELKKQLLLDKLETLKLNKCIQDIKAVGLPNENYIIHSGMILSYNEEHEQANWVMHMILPDIKNGVVFRTNDFRVDTFVSTGTAVQEDYFLTDTLASGKVNYDGFGFDRGHLAPSADFRWSKRALSESYFYSNMSPQLADFNRNTWAELEGHLRKYVIENNTPLYIVTAPKLVKDLPKVERSINGVSIPAEYAKFVYDPINKRSIAFILKNTASNGPIQSYAMSIDEAEKNFNIDVFPNVDATEGKIVLEDWFANLQNGDKEPLAQNELPKLHFNTVIGAKRINKKSIVCGHVVSQRISRSGHLWINLDNKFPNQTFSIFIRKEDLVNLPYDPIILNEKNYCFEGKVELINDVATMNIKRGKHINPLK